MTLQARMAPSVLINDDVLIVGGGLAGLFTALKLAPRPVTVLAAAPIGEGASSAWAQGGIAAAMSPGDTVEKHLADTLVAGAGIVDEAIARMMVSEGPARIEDLLAYGVPFDRDLEGQLALSREAAHSERRVVRVRGDLAGRAIMEALVAAVRRTPSIRVLEGVSAEDLIGKDGAVRGVVARTSSDDAARRIAFQARAVVLCSGGIGRLYAVTTNPPEAAGQGLGMAARAGARIADPEFVQFHPTALDVGRDPAPLATEALRGEGATLVNRAGHRFMADLHPDAELAPRDVVARGIFAEIAAGRGAFLDATRAVGTAFPEAFPTVYAACMAAGIDPVRMPIPVAPAAHYHMGGILSDRDGRTSLEGLWAAGEVASTGVHGANRLASNSLLEAVVFAARVAADVARGLPTPQRYEARLEPEAAAAGEDAESLARLRRLMSMEVGVVRDRAGLERAIGAILAMERAGLAMERAGLAMERAGNVRPAFANMLAAAKLVAVAAWRREESRGGHARADYAEPRAAFAHRTLLTLAEADRTARAIASASRPMQDQPYEGMSA